MCVGGLCVATTTVFYAANGPDGPLHLRKAPCTRTLTEVRELSSNYSLPLTNRSFSPTLSIPRFMSLHNGLIMHRLHISKIKKDPRQGVPPILTLLRLPARHVITLVRMQQVERIRFTLYRSAVYEVVFGTVQIQCIITRGCVYSSQRTFGQEEHKGVATGMFVRNFI